MFTATEIALTYEERETLRMWVRGGKTEHRTARRARIILAAAEGESTTAIAERLDERPSTVSKWRMRFALQRLPGLQDAFRAGRKPRYDETSRERVLAMLDEPPPTGFSQWNGRLLSSALGNVSVDQVRRILRRGKIQLQRRRSWCLSTDPEFGPKAADIVGLYLHPPQNAVVVSVDERPHTQALDRAQGYLRMPNGAALRGVSVEYKRNGTTTLFAALNTVTGKVFGRPSKRKRHRECLAFMNDVVAVYPNREIHVILDNLSTHKPKHDRWLASHPNVHLHFTPNHASFMNQIECWFSILSRSALRNASFTSPVQLREAIDRFIAVYNEDAVPFEWTKTEVHPTSLKEYIAHLRC